VDELAGVGVVDANGRVGLGGARHEPVVVSEGADRSGDVAAVAGEIYGRGADPDGGEGVVDLGGGVRAG
jgi:hypothetical protein